LTGDDGMMKRPPGLEGLAGQLFDVLAQYITFPWALLETQAKRLGLDPMSLSAEDARELVPKLAEGVARFTDAETGAHAAAELGQLLMR
jgi:hypothetical protein